MRYAGMWVIKLLPADVTDFEFDEGDLIDIESQFILAFNKKKKKKTHRKKKEEKLSKK